MGTMRKDSLFLVDELLSFWPGSSESREGGSYRNKMVK